MSVTDGDEAVIGDEGNHCLLSLKFYSFLSGQQAY